MTAPTAVPWTYALDTLSWDTDTAGLSETLCKWASA